MAGLKRDSMIAEDSLASFLVSEFLGRGVIAAGVDVSCAFYSGFFA